MIEYFSPLRIQIYKKYKILYYTYIKIGLGNKYHSKAYCLYGSVQIV